MAKWNRLLEEAFQRKLPEWYRVCIAYNPPGPDRIISLEGEFCPECGEETIYCCRDDFGHVDCEPKFTHICISPWCPYVIENEIEGVSFPDLESQKEYCPWCTN